MKFLKVTAAVFACLLALVPVLVACGGTDDPAESEGGDTAQTPAETTSSATETVGEITRAPVPVGEPLTDRTEFVLESGDQTMNLKISGNELTITSLATKATGKNVVSGKDAFSLPDKYQKSKGKYASFEWKYECYFNYEAEDGEYDEYGYIFRFEDADAGFVYDLYFTAHYKFDGPFEVYGYLKNESSAAKQVYPSDYISLNTVGEKAPTAWDFRKESGMAEGWTLYNGTTYSGTGIYKTVMKKSATVNVTYTTDQDWNSGGDIPMLYLDYGTSGVYIAHEWTSGIINAKSENGKGDVAVKVTLTKGFKTLVLKGESLYMPSVYIGAYDGSVDNGSNVFKRWFLYNKAPSNLLENEDEPLSQEDMQIGIPDSQYGIQSLKWDYGWWESTQVTAGAQWRTPEGLLEISSSMLNTLKNIGASDIKSFTSMLKKRGISLATYILLKDTGLSKSGVPTSVGANGHPEWFSNRVVTVGKSADLGNEDCVKFFQTYMADFFNENGVTTWRSDFEPICRESDKANRHYANGTDVQYWCTVGFAELVDYLYENVDGFRYESCCSGGAMKDFFTMTKAVVLNCDDSADYMSLRMSFYDSSYCMHPVQLQLPCNASTYEKSEYYVGTADVRFGFRSQLVGAVMLSNWRGTQGVDKTLWQTYMPTYNSRIKPLMKYGDLYHILPRPDGKNWDGIAYINKDSETADKGIIEIFKPSDSEGKSKTVVLEGLYEDVTYSIEYFDHSELNCKKTGKELMTEGLTVTFDKTVDSDWIFIRAK